MKGSFHGLSHHRNIEAQRAQYEKIVTWNIEQAAYSLKRLAMLHRMGVTETSFGDSTGPLEDLS